MKKRRGSKEYSTELQAEQNRALDYEVVDGETDPLETSIRSKDDMILGYSLNGFDISVSDTEEEVATPEKPRVAKIVSPSRSRSVSPGTKKKSKAAMMETETSSKKAKRRGSAGWVSVVESYQGTNNSPHDGYSSDGALSKKLKHLRSKDDGGNAKKESDDKSARSRSRSRDGKRRSSVKSKLGG
mmetsp:Transcript_45026/g.68897  ORF Transcript_45026/g.68897 Transcript_45026/m.68897 type:complete len:185 (+) Transcript_45026:292-846(+)